MYAFSTDTDGIITNNITCYEAARLAAHHGFGANVVRQATRSERAVFVGFAVTGAMRATNHATAEERTILASVPM